MASVGLLRRLQIAIDAYYLHTYYAGALRVQAYRCGREQELKGKALAAFIDQTIANPSEEHMALARKEAYRLQALRKQRWRYVSWLTAVVWLVAFLYCAFTSPVLSLSPKTILLFFVGVVVAKFILAGAFQILWGISNFLKLAAIAAIEAMMIAEPSQSHIRWVRISIGAAIAILMLAFQTISTAKLAILAFDYFAA